MCTRDIHTIIYTQTQNDEKKNRQKSKKEKRKKHLK